MSKLYEFEAGIKIVPDIDGAYVEIKNRLALNDK